MNIPQTTSPLRLHTCIVLFLCLTGFINLHSIAYAAATTTPKVVLKIPATRTLEPHFYGFNSPYICAKDIPGNFMSPKAQFMIKTTGAQILRFPGGTFSNFLNWDTFTLDEAFIRTVGKKKLFTTGDYQRSINNGKLVKADLDTFMQATQNRGIQPVIVLNFFGYNAQQLIGHVDRVKKKYKTKIIWEMGNEVSYYEYRFNLNKNIPGGWDEKIYMGKVQAIAQHIRKNYPKDFIVIVSNEIVKGKNLQKVPEHILQKILPWGKELTQKKYSKLFDAVSVHPYIMMHDDEYWEKSYFKQYHIEIPKTNARQQIRKLRRTWSFMMAQEYPKQYIKFFKQNYPGKQALLSELGLLVIGKNDRKARMDEINRTLHGTLFNTVYFMNWLKYQPLIKGVMFHALVHGQSGVAAFFKDFSLNANSFSYIMIKKALADSQKFGILNITNSPTFRGLAQYKNVKVKSLTAAYFETDQSAKILIANTADSSVNLTLPFQRSRITYLTRDINKPIVSGEFKNFESFAKTRTAGKTWRMPPFSIALIKKQK